MALNRSDLVKPELPRETVAVPALGGDVIVRGLLLGEAEWEAFGGVNFTAALELFTVARRLSGLDAEVIEKN